MIHVGIDGGSRAIKIVLLDADHRVLAQGLCDQGVEQEAQATRLLDSLLHQVQATRGDLGRVIATGYSRNNLRLASATVTEITCHARGVRHQVAQARSIIEIGGQDSKVIHLDEKGHVRDFAMNDRCAAGTGRFLEVVASRMDASLDELGRLSSQSSSPACVSSTCVVFAETEIIGLLASKTPREDIVAGVQNAIAQRIVAMAGRMLHEPIVFTGGVALIAGMRTALEQALEVPVTISPSPQMTGALGAALIAADSHTTR